MAAGSSKLVLRIGTAGWSLSRAVAEHFTAEGSHLERYAARFNAVEINSSFYRPHKPATYARWAASVPVDFRFAVKLPKAITHERRLVDSDDLLARFADEVAQLGNKRGPVLMQLPPSLAFDATSASAFFALARERLGGAIVCEPRHPSWFLPMAEHVLSEHGIARVAADPAPVPEAADPGGWSGLRYTRLHGSPRIYWSRYDEAEIARRAETEMAADVESWTIFDNTASGAAIPDALSFRDRVVQRD